MNKRNGDSPKRIHTPMKNSHYPLSHTTQFLEALRCLFIGKIWGIIPMYQTTAEKQAEEDGRVVMAEVDKLQGGTSEDFKDPKNPEEEFEHFCTSGIAFAIFSSKRRPKTENRPNRFTGAKSGVWGVGGSTILSEVEGKPLLNRNMTSDPGPFRKKAFRKHTVESKQPSKRD